MSSDWVDMQLGDFVELKRCYDLPKRNRKKGDVPVVSSPGVSGFHDKSKVKAPGVVTGRYGTIGKVFYIEEDFWPLNTTLYVKDFKGNDPLFVYYFLKTISYQDYSDKAAVPGVNRNHLHTATIRVPNDLGEQRGLALKLWSLDQKIELNRQINQTLEQIAQAIFKSWFVDFEPVKAKIRANEEWRIKNGELKGNNSEPSIQHSQFINRAAMRAISGKSDEELNQLPADQLEQLRATAALFPDELVDSELGLIPKGWEVSLLGKHSEILNGHAFKSKDYVADGIFVFRTKNFSDSGYSERLSDDVFLPREFSESHSKFLCRPFDYHLVMVAASIGKTAVIFPHHLPALRNQNMWCFRAKKNFPSKIYLYHTVSKVVKELVGWASGSARSFFRKGDYQNQKVILPNTNLLAHFESITFSMLNQISIKDSETNRLSELRDSLLPKLLAGELVTNLHKEAV